jgi:prepilin-type N-terminal cleavage/methylation domain-containing protein
MNRGFTIVELLIVVVIIGILASVTVVSYNGITQRANTSAAQAATSTVIKKIALYHVEFNRYPYAASDLNSITSSYHVPNTISYTLGTTQPATPSVLRYVKCGSGSPANQAAINITAGNITGVRIHYWTYTGTPSANNYQLIGADSGTGVLCPSS